MEEYSGWESCSECALVLRKDKYMNEDVNDGSEMEQSGDSTETIGDRII